MFKYRIIELEAIPGDVLIRSAQKKQLRWGILFADCFVCSAASWVAKFWKSFHTKNERFPMKIYTSSLVEMLIFFFPGKSSLHSFMSAISWSWGATALLDRVVSQFSELLSNSTCCCLIISTLCPNPVGRWVCGTYQEIEAQASEWSHRM